MNNLAAFDYISDLNLTDISQFSLDKNPPTALFCIVGGGISSDIYVLKHTLLHLSKHYKGVFYIDGALEHNNVRNYSTTIESIGRFIDCLENVCYLHTNVVIVDGIALLAINGWYGNIAMPDDLADIEIISHLRHQDILYLCRSVEKLQRHPDVQQIIIISNSPPSAELTFGTNTKLAEMLGPNMVLDVDTQNKISHWLYGTFTGGAQVKKDDILYINNPRIEGQEYRPKRIQIWH